VIRVLLADDNAFVRDALVELFTSCDDMTVVAACADGDEVAPAVAATRPDVVLLDVAMPVSGLTAAHEVLEADPDARIVFLTADASAATARQARGVGARGILLKDLDPDALCAAIRRVARGETVWRGGSGPASSRVTQSPALGHLP
jgi:two-component system response regulator DesR